jgi:hypothetical protein
VRQAQAAEAGKQKVKCNRTLGAGGDIGAALRSAPDGSTLCLGGGAYDGIDVGGIDKSPPVLVRSAPGTMAQVRGIELDDVSGVTFAGLELTEGIGLTPVGHNVGFVGNDITGTHGIYMFGDYRLGDRISHVRIERNYIHDIQYEGSQEPGFGYGIAGLGDVRHVVVAHNVIQRVASDYVQSATPHDWLVDHNTFLGPSLLGNHEDHQDLWQIFGGGIDVTFTNNVARDTETQESLLFQTGHFENVLIRNNLFVNDSLGYTCQLYQSNGLVFRFNTIVGSRWGCLFRDEASEPPGGGYRVERNIFVKTREGPGIATEGRAGSWGTYQENVSDDGSARGPHSIRRWKPRFRNRAGYWPLGLPYMAGYHGPGGAGY